MTQKLKIVFFGNERLATGVTTETPALKALIAAGYEIAAIISNYEPGQSRNSRELEIKVIGEANDIPVLLPEKPGDILDQLKVLNAEVGILAAYGKIVPQSIIDAFPRGIINIHPSLLPLHRGPTPIESVILQGESKTGVSIMQLTKTMDTGPVYGYSEVELDGTETKQSLAALLSELGSKLLLELLPEILNGNLIAKPQDEAAATYDKLISKEDGRIDWNNPAEQIEREIRAYREWPKSYTELSGKDVIITKAHVALKPQENELAKKTGIDYLVIDMLKPAGKNEMTAAEFIRGYGKDL
ncbi:methionyl-tRNA formyltransferase [Candidatus Saccharibacteria bacterium]|nr:methionyl-tRNA formyltransferase [Candidatus Saccharibacteria bacterium]